MKLWRNASNIIIEFVLFSLVILFLIMGKVEISMVVGTVQPKTHRRCRPNRWRKHGEVVVVPGKIF